MREPDPDPEQKKQVREAPSHRLERETRTSQVVVRRGGAAEEDPLERAGPPKRCSSVSTTTPGYAPSGCRESGARVGTYNRTQSQA